MIFLISLILLKNLFSKLYIFYESLEIFSSNIFADPHQGKKPYAPCTLISEKILEKLFF